MKTWVSKVISYSTRAALALVLLIIGFAIFGFLASTRPTVPRSESEETARRVEVLEIAAFPLRRIWEGFGTAKAMDSADVTAEISAIVKGIPNNLRAGDQVSKGEAIVILDDRDVRQRMVLTEQTIAGLQAQLDSLQINRTRTEEQLELAEEEYQLAKADYERGLESFEQGGSNQAELDRLRRAMKGAARIESEIRKQLEMIEPRATEIRASMSAENARLALVKRDLERCTIRSPIEGTLQALHVEKGEQTQIGMLVARVVNTRRIEVPIRFPISAVQSVRRGDEVQLTSEGARNDCWTATISRLAPESDANLRTCIAYAELTQSADADPLLVPGQFLKARLETALSGEYLAVPRRAVLDESVWVIEANDTAEQRYVEVLFHVPASVDLDTLYSKSFPGEEWAALSGASDLIAGERVILSHVDEMKPGLEVQAQDPNKVTSSERGTEAGGG